MAASYKKLFKLLIDRDMKRKNLPKKPASASLPSPRWVRTAPLSAVRFLSRYARPLNVRWMIL